MRSESGASTNGCDRVIWEDLRMRALLFVVIIVMVAPLIAFASHVESHPWLWAAIVIWVAFAVAFLWEVFVGPIRLRKSRKSSH